MKKFPLVQLGAGVVLIAAVAVPLAGAKAQAKLVIKYPPIGKMVDVGGYRLHLYCEGQGTPTVVFDAGAGLGAGLAWAHLIPKIAKHTRACFYDRAGQGWSDAGPQPRTSEVMVEELRTLLHRSGVPAPYILVGYSFGALNMRLYAYKYPHEVAGLVLVDGSHEDQMRAYGEKPSPLVLGMLNALPFIVRTGIPALVPQLLPIDGKDHLPPDAVRAYQALAAADAKMAEAAVGEMVNIESSFAQVRAARSQRGETPLGDIPLTAIMRGRAHTVPGSRITPEEQMRIWRELQQDIVQQTTRGKLVVAEQSKHDLLYTQPELVANAIVELLAQK